MARSIPPEGDDLDSDQTPEARCARYWKKAARMYSLACSAEAPEVKGLYMRVAMSWAAMANELERGTITGQAAGSAPEDHYRH